LALAFSAPNSAFRTITAGNLLVGPRMYLAARARGERREVLNGQKIELRREPRITSNGYTRWARILKPRREGRGKFSKTDLAEDRRLHGTADVRKCLFDKGGDFRVRKSVVITGLGFLM
jgi:hypothetical protein